MQLGALCILTVLGLAGCLEVRFGEGVDGGGGTTASGGTAGVGGASVGGAGAGGAIPEICDNLLDDDGDLAIDCLDDDCDCTVPAGWMGPLALGDACGGEGVELVVSLGSSGTCDCTCETTPCVLSSAESSDSGCDPLGPEVALPTNTCVDLAPNTEGVVPTLAQGSCTVSSSLSPASSESTLVCASPVGTCVQAEGTLDCPPEYPTRALDAWRGLDDQRSCDCACSVPACTAFLALFGQPGCSGGMSTVFTFGDCEEARDSMRATYMQTACSSPDVDPTGELIGTMPVTICCQ
jgi:hypothetical protein